MESFPLHNLIPPKIILQHEDAMDRNIFFLVAQGFNDTEIAAELGLTRQKVSLTRRQPWFTERLVEVLHKAGAPAIEQRLQTLFKEMMERGANLARNAESEAVQCQAVFNLCKLARGEKVIVQDERRPLEELQKERMELEERLKEIRGEKTNRQNTPEPSVDGSGNGNGEVVSKGI